MLCPQGINMTALREIKLLKELESPYIVRLLDVFPHKRNLSLVLSRLLIKSYCAFELDFIVDPVQRSLSVST